MPTAYGMSSWRDEFEGLCCCVLGIGDARLLGRGGGSIEPWLLGEDCCCSRTRLAVLLLLDDIVAAAYKEGPKEKLLWMEAAKTRRQFAML